MIYLDENGKKNFAIVMNELDEDFVDTLDFLINKYGEKLLKMNSLHNDNLNFNEFIKAFIDSSTPADVSSDGNANSSSKDICTLMSDMNKPHSKLLAFNKIYIEIKKFFDKETADRWAEEEWTGASYLHDFPSSSFKPYCFAYDLDQLVERGLFFVNKFPTGPAKHLTTFNDHVLEFISWNCNRTSGAKMTHGSFVQ